MAVKFDPIDPTRNIVEEIARRLGLPTPTTLALLTTDPSTGSSPKEGLGYVFTQMVRRGFDPVVADQLINQFLGSAGRRHPAGDLVDHGEPVEVRNLPFHRGDRVENVLLNSPGAPAETATTSRAGSASQTTASGIPPRKQAPGESPSGKPPGKFRRGLQGIVSRTPAQFPFQEIDPREAPIITLAKGFANTLVAGARREQGLREEGYEQRRIEEAERRTDIEEQGLILSQEASDRAARAQALQQNMLTGNYQDVMKARIAAQPLGTQQAFAAAGGSAERMAQLLASENPADHEELRRLNGMLLPETELRINAMTDTILNSEELRTFHGLQPGDVEKAREFARAMDPETDMYDLLNTVSQINQQKAVIANMDTDNKTKSLGTIATMVDEHLKLRYALEQSMAAKRAAQAQCALLGREDVDPDIKRGIETALLQNEEACPVDMSGVEASQKLLDDHVLFIQTTADGFGKEVGDRYRDMLSGKKVSTTPTFDPEARGAEIVEGMMGIKLPSPTDATPTPDQPGIVGRHMRQLVEDTTTTEGLNRIGDAMDLLTAELMSGFDYEEDPERVGRGRTTGAKVFGTITRRVGRQINFLQSMFADVEGAVQLEPFVQRALAGDMDNDPRFDSVRQSVARTAAKLNPGGNLNDADITRDAATVLWYVINKDGEDIPASALRVLVMPGQLNAIDQGSLMPVDPTKEPRGQAAQREYNEQRAREKAAPQQRPTTGPPGGTPAGPYKPPGVGLGGPPGVLKGLPPATPLDRFTERRRKP